MSRPVLFATALLFVAGCSNGFGNTADDTGGDGTGDDGEGTFVEGAEDLPRVDQDLVTTGCEEVSGSELPGAVSYFFGTYAEASDGWIGEEEWRLYANDTWTANGGADCSVFWVISASETSPGSCGNCDVGLAISAAIDRARTTCGEDLTKNEETFTVTYGVDITDQGSKSSWYFPESGTNFGWGNALTTDGSPTALNYATDKTCQWF
ncbi:MAG: hypothetical protein H6742_07530 [Alphaproteobacteria bacterium]|nr:hypothetical protein [Alphaproteobacteria bacterium]